MSERFSYKILDKDRIQIIIQGRDVTDADGKFIDTFTEKIFEINPKELLTLQRICGNIAFDWCSTFKCRLDDPVCH